MEAVFIKISIQSKMMNITTIIPQKAHLIQGIAHRTLKIDVILKKDGQDLTPKRYRLVLAKGGLTIELLFFLLLKIRLLARQLSTYPCCWKFGLIIPKRTVSVRNIWNDNL